MCYTNNMKNDKTTNNDKETILILQEIVKQQGQLITRLIKLINENKK